ncbi:hypothetical protein [Microvirga subterranea]|uniref:Uncharacterized protein n=1 Tax=Microvirga subterranea TaxID=186651 RepID=A0A370HVK4_9HYPH|nr:hypothetical protein [Microvirga subterranea]RDI62455.1 hypothetical protein DES45_101725 [Microvirga subterranea]
MTGHKPSEPRVPTERPDPKAANRKPEAGSEDRPGFDLGGASDENTTGVGSNTVPGGPRSSTSSGSNASGRADGSGSES